MLQFVLTDLDDDRRAWCDTFVALVAELVVSRGQYTDTFMVHEQTAGLALAETLRRLSHAVLDHAGGTLTDDVTVLLVEYRGAENG